MEYIVFFRKLCCFVISRGKFFIAFSNSDILGIQVVNNKGCLKTEYKSYCSLVSGGCD